MSDTETTPIRPAAPSSQVITDGLGRSLTIREIGPMQQLDLFEAAADQAGNTSWIGMAFLACSVIEMDGVPVPFPRSKQSIRLLADRLGKEGISAVAKALRTEDEAAGLDIVATAKN